MLFIIPGMLVTLILAWAYVAYGSLPEVGWVLYGVKPVVIAIILQALWDLGKKAVKGWVTAFVGIGVLAFYLLGLNEILLLFAGASVVVAVYAIRRYRWKSAAAVVGAPLVNLPVIAAGVAGFSQTTLFLSFLKIGAGLYGSGYVLVAFMRSEFVTQLGWLTNQQLLDAVAVGQATPGPVFTIATFAGYLVGSWPGALLATLCIFLSSFVFVALLSRILPWSKKSPWARHFLDGVNVASLCLMAAVTWQLGRDGVVDAFTIVLTVVFLMLVIRFKVNLIWLIIGGAVLGVGWKLLKG